MYVEYHVVAGHKENVGRGAVQPRARWKGRRVYRPFAIVGNGRLYLLQIVNTNRYTRCNVRTNAGARPVCR